MTKVYLYGNGVTHQWFSRKEGNALINLKQTGNNSDHRECRNRQLKFDLNAPLKNLPPKNRAPFFVENPTKNALFLISITYISAPCGPIRSRFFLNWSRNCPLHWELSSNAFPVEPRYIITEILQKIEWHKSLSLRERRYPTMGFKCRGLCPYQFKRNRDQFWPQGAEKRAIEICLKRPHQKTLFWTRKSSQNHMNEKEKKFVLLTLCFHTTPLYCAVDRVKKFQYPQ